MSNAYTLNSGKVEPTFGVNKGNESRQEKSKSVAIARES